MYYFLDENKIIIGTGIEPHSVYESINEEELPKDVENPMGYTYIKGKLKKSQDLIEVENFLKTKEKEESLKSLRITVGSKVFAADEASQNRVLRALQVMEKTESIDWLLADGSTAKVTYTELQQALRLMVSETSKILTEDSNGK